VLVVVDDYAFFTWTLFLDSKDETFKKFLVFLKRAEKRVGHSLVCLRSNHDKEFENLSFINFCNEHGVDHNFLPQEHPNRTG